MEISERTMHPGFVMEMLERRPEVAIEWLCLVREVGGGRWLERYGEELFERAMHPDFVMKMLERRPEVAIEWLRLAREVKGGHWLEQRYGEELFAHAMHTRFVMEVLERRPEVAVEWLRLAREVEGGRWLERYGAEFFERAIHANLGKLPLEYVRDIRWYAEITSNNELMREIQSYMGEIRVSPQALPPPARDTH